MGNYQTLCRTNNFPPFVTSHNITCLRILIGRVYALVRETDPFIHDRIVMESDGQALAFVDGDALERRENMKNKSGFFSRIFAYVGFV